MSDGQYSHTNSRGNQYFLNSKNVILRGGKKQTIFYFTKEAGKLTACGLPEGFEVSENPRNGFLVLKKAK